MAKEQPEKETLGEVMPKPVRVMVHIQPEHWQRIRAIASQEYRTPREHIQMLVEKSIKENVYGREFGGLSAAHAPVPDFPARETMAQTSTQHRPQDALSNDR